MKTNLLKKDGVLHRLTRLPKILLLAGVAAILALPQAEARPDRHRHHHHRGGGEYYRHRGHDHRVSYGPRYYAPPRHVHRGWARPGFYGTYPPLGYVDYRYIRSLPRGYRVVYRGGHRYYYSNGSYYWPARYNDGGVFISVRF